MSPGDEVNKVVDKLAEKVGVAVNNLMPVAERLIAETVATGWIILGIWVMFVAGLTVGVVLVLRCEKRYRALAPECAASSADAEFMRFMRSASLVAYVTVVAGVTPLFLWEGLSRIVAPTKHLLGL